MLASASSSATHPCCWWPIMTCWAYKGRSSFLGQVGISFLLGTLCFPVDLELCPDLAEVQAHLVIPELPRVRDFGACASCWLQSSASGCWASLCCGVGGGIMSRISHQCLGLWAPPARVLQHLSRSQRWICQGGRVYCQL